MQSFREMLREAAQGRQQAIALETFPGAPSSAEAETSKYLSGQRGERLWELIENTFRFGDRDVIRRWVEKRLAPPNPGEALAEIKDQLDLFESRVGELKRQIEDYADVIPIQRNA